MLSSVVVVALAALAQAAPLEDRAVTVTEVTDVYTTVYDDSPAAAAPAPTTTAEVKWWKFRGKGKGKPTTSVVYVTPTAEPVPEATTAAPVADSPSPSYQAPAATPTAASGGGYTGGNDYAKSVTDHHNAHRANHSAPALEWDDALAATALKIAQSCNYAHDV
jgi:hypothetical protein